jgi:O-acetyl-ADP-ribose deacetylase (regulator of RNase III)
MKIVIEQQFQSVAFPLIGAGTGCGSPEKVQRIMLAELSNLPFGGDVYIVRYVPASKGRY